MKYGSPRVEGEVGVRSDKFILALYKHKALLRLEVVTTYNPSLHALGTAPCNAYDSARCPFLIVSVFVPPRFNYV